MIVVDSNVIAYLYTWAGEQTAAAERVLALAAVSGHTAYDCEFVAVAQALGAQLVAADRQVLASFPEVAVSLCEYGA